MKYIASKRPSPAMIIALIALIAALGGTALAATKISGKTIKKLSLPGNRVEKHSLPGNRVKKNALKARHINEQTLVEVKRSTIAEGPVAMAHVLDDGTLVAADSRGITQANVTRDDVGQYCFRGLKFPVQGASAVVDIHDSSLGDAIRVSIPDDSLVCNGGAQVGVEIGDNGSFDDAGFYIQFWN